MSNNLFVSYDLCKPNQNYNDVIAEIKMLGDWAKVHQSLWYVNSSLSAQEAAERVWAKMDSNDKLIVVNASANDAQWYNLSDEVAKYIQEKWPL